MIRRTLALAGAAALAVGFTGLAGPAAADSDAGIAQTGSGVVINEVGADLDLFSSGYDGGFIELINLGEGVADVGEWEVTGCTDSNTFSVKIPDGTMLPEDATYLVADFEFAGETPDRQFKSGEVLEQAAGGARLEDDLSGLQDEIEWGPEDSSVNCASSPAGALPTDTQSINRADPSWVHANPTPEPLN